MIRELVCVVMAFLILSGCAGCKFGDGKIDIVEAGVIRVAVGVAMSSRPESVAPAYAVSTALLKIVSRDSVSEVSVIDLAISMEVAGLGLSEAERLVFMDLVGAIKGVVVEQLAALPNTESRRVIVCEVLQIVRDAAVARFSPQNQNTAGE